MYNFSPTNSLFDILIPFEFQIPEEDQNEMGGKKPTTQRRSSKMGCNFDLLCSYSKWNETNGNDTTTGREMEKEAKRQESVQKIGDSK